MSRTRHGCYLILKFLFIATRPLFSFLRVSNKRAFDVITRGYFDTFFITMIFFLIILDLAYSLYSIMKS
jgi:hypothetical protein